MIGASRNSLAKVQGILFSVKGDLSALSTELFEIATLLTNEKGLLLKFADSGLPATARQQLVSDLFGKKVSKETVETMSNIISARWSSGSDLLDAIEILGAQALFVYAEKSKKLDLVGDEIFKFGRLLDSSAELQMALTDPATTAESKANLVDQLLNKKIDGTTLSVIKYFAANLRGRRVDAIVDLLVSLAAAQQSSVVAEVRSAVELDKSQKDRLEKALAKITGNQVRVNVAIEPNVIGGISVRIGQEIIDGTFATRLEQARRSLLT